jgi:hypothetical protein
MPATPVAAASRPAPNGSATWPMRLPTTRSEFAVPRAGFGVRSITVVTLRSAAVPIVKPFTATVTCMAQSGSGAASSRKASAATPLHKRHFVWLRVD